MAFSSLPLYHLDPQVWHNQYLNDEQQILLQSQQHDDITSPRTQPAPLIENGVDCGGSATGSIKPNSMVDRARQAQLPLPEPGLKCPRCESTNTKFCYFNNYNLSQPRHFCKTCRRYWTRGGSLRNVPVGGGCRRTAKRTKPRPASTSPGVGLRSLGTSISSHLGGSSMMQLPFLPSLHYLGNPNNPNGHVGVEMEFPNLLAGFEGLGRMNSNGMHPFESPSHVSLIGQSFHQSRPSNDQMDEEMVDRRALVKLEETRGVNLAKEFALVQGNNENLHHQFNWNTHMWSNGSDLPGFGSPSSANHLLG